MRIINNPNPAKETIVVCTNCKCEFAYNGSDVKQESYNNGILGPRWNGYVHEYVYCPNCGKIHTLYKGVG